MTDRKKIICATIGLQLLRFHIKNLKQSGLPLSPESIHNFWWTHFDIRPHFFDLLDYVTRRSEILGFQKKKKKKEGISTSSGEKCKLD